MTEQEYRAHPALHYSILKELEHSFARFEYVRNLPPEAQKDTPALRFGKAYDTYLLQEDVFANEFYVLDPKAAPEPEKTMASKANKEWKAQKESEYGTNIISVDEYFDLMRMKDALMNHPIAGYYLKTPGGMVQTPTFFQLYGLDFKMKTDLQFPDLGIIIDLKTIISIDKFCISQAVNKYRYYWQQYLYRVGLEEFYGKPFDFYFIFQAKQPPHDVAVVQLDREYTVQASIDVQRLCEKYRWHLNNPSQFKGEHGGVLQIEMPKYLSNGVEVSNYDDDDDEEGF